MALLKHKCLSVFTTINSLGLSTCRNFSTTIPGGTARPLKKREFEKYIAQCLQKASALPNAKPFDVISPYYDRKRSNGKFKKHIAVDVAVKFKNVPSYEGEPNWLENANTKKVRPQLMMVELKTLPKKSRNG